jgi:hypothetical protein
MRYMLLIYADDQALGKTTPRGHCYVESAQPQGYLVATKFKLWSSLLTWRPSPRELSQSSHASPLGERVAAGSTALGDPTLGGKRLLGTI